MLRWIGIASLLLPLIASFSHCEKKDHICVVFLDDRCNIGGTVRKGDQGVLYEQGLCAGGRYENLYAKLDIEVLSYANWTIEIDTYIPLAKNRITFVGKFGKTVLEFPEGEQARLHWETPGISGYWDYRIELRPTLHRGTFLDHDYRRAKFTIEAHEIRKGEPTKLSDLMDGPVIFRCNDLRYGIYSITLDDPLYSQLIRKVDPPESEAALALKASGDAIAACSEDNVCLVFINDECKINDKWIKGQIGVLWEPNVCKRGKYADLYAKIEIEILSIDAWIIEITSYLSIEQNSFTFGDAQLSFDHDGNATVNWKLGEKEGSGKFPVEKGVAIPRSGGASFDRFKFKVAVGGEKLSNIFSAPVTYNDPIIAQKFVMDDTRYSELMGNITPSDVREFRRTLLIGFLIGGGILLIIVVAVICFIVWRCMRNSKREVMTKNPTSRANSHSRTPLISPKSKSSTKSD